MKFKNYQWIAAALCLVSATALADDIRFGAPISAGTGCPAGTTTALVSPDQKIFAIVFDDYTAQSDVRNGKKIDRKTCNIAIPVHAPQGYSIALSQIDYRGYSSVPSGGLARLNVNHFFSGGRGLQRSVRMIGPVDEEFVISHPVGIDGLVWTPCGADTNLRIDSSLVAQASQEGEDTLATLDNPIVFGFLWRRCY